MLFSPLNFAVLFIYLGAMLFIGWRLSGRQRSTEDFFLAGRRMPWVIVAMSMYASLTSAVTFLALPSIAYSSNISLIVVCFVSPLVAPFLIKMFYPFYQRLKITTSYEYVGARFGPGARYAASALFILARLGWLGTVVYAPSMALSAVTGLPLWAAILMMGAVATAYTVMGGVEADIWSDVVQFVIMVGGAVWVAATLVASTPGGLSGILEVAGDAGRLTVFQWPWTLDRMSGVPIAVCFFFQLMYDYGTDQTTVQRLMATPTLKGISRAIFFNAAVDFFVIALLLFIGIGLFAYCAANPTFLQEGLRGDQRLPFYIVHALPDGVSGLLVTAIFAAMMSSMDSGISSLSTVVVSDFVQPLRGREGDQRGDLRMARLLTLAFGGAATGVAFYVSRFESLIEAYTSIISLFNGPILALFLLGIMSRRVVFPGWIVGVCVSLPATFWFQKMVRANWTYHFPFSFATALVVTWVASFAFRPREADERLLLNGQRAYGGD